MVLHAEYTDFQEVDNPNKDGEDLQGIHKERKNYENLEKEDDETALITEEKN
jgi:hypothetical protein